MYYYQDTKENRTACSSPHDIHPAPWRLDWRNTQTNTDIWQWTPARLPRCLRPKGTSLSWPHTVEIKTKSFTCSNMSIHVKVWWKWCHAFRCRDFRLWCCGWAGQRLLPKAVGKIPLVMVSKKLTHIAPGNSHVNVTRKFFASPVAIGPYLVQWF